MNKYTADEDLLEIPCRVYLPAECRTILVDLCDLPPAALTPEVIAHSLATKNRYNGHTPYPYSVAIHSVLVYALLRPGEEDLALEALMHDAAEAFVGDVINPIKREIKALYSPIEKRVEAQIRRAFQLNPIEPPAVKRADVRALWCEQQLLQGKPWDHEEPEDWRDMEIARLLCSREYEWKAASAMFLLHYQELTRKRAA